jgi:hypothetical protein
LTLLTSRRNGRKITIVGGYGQARADAASKLAWRKARRRHGVVEAARRL